MLERQVKTQLGWFIKQWAIWDWISNERQYPKNNNELIIK